MAIRNDGGNFSDDPIARLLAMKLGSASEQDLAQQEKIPEEAINTASGVVGRIAPVTNFPSIGKSLGTEFAQKAAPAIEQGPLSWLDKYKQAVTNTKIKQLDKTPMNFGKVIIK